MRLFARMTTICILKSYIGGKDFDNNAFGSYTHCEQSKEIVQQAVEQFIDQGNYWQMLAKSSSLKNASLPKTT